MTSLSNKSDKCFLLEVFRITVSHLEVRNLARLFLPMLDSPINQFHDVDLFPYPLKSSEILKGYRKKPVA